MKRWPVAATFLVFLAFLQLTKEECPIPKRRLPHGHFIFQSEQDVDLNIAPENYLLQFQCYKNYTLRGAKAILCSSNRWTDRIPKCIKLSCNDPPSIKDGYYKVNAGTSYNTVLGSIVEYTCKNGYELVNSTTSVLNCGLSEDNVVMWKGEVPGCKPKELCLDPGVSKDGKRIGDSFYVGDFLNFTCNRGFDLIGNDSIECLLGGNWSSPRPLCKPVDDHCDLPPVIAHGLIKGDKEGDYYRPFDEVEVFCEPGYTYKGQSRYLMCEEEGIWEDDFYECTEVYCDTPGILANGTIPELENLNTTSFPYNFEITYVCDKGFRLVGDSWRYCGSKGWSGKSPHCEMIRCPDPGAPEHGTLSIEGFEVGNKAFFNCFSGFELIGTFERYCLPNGQWSGELARCNHKNNYCPDPGIPINGMKNSSNYDMGEIIGFRCRSGYTLLGSETRECLPSRRWSGSQVKCVGPYDFDSSIQVSDTLLQIITAKEEEQKKETEEYRALQASVGTLGRILNVNFPGRLVLYFAFDVSGSVREHNFRKSIEFAKAIVKRIGISDIGARAGALTFGSKAESQFLPIEYKTTEEVLDALDRINYTGGGTSASSALAMIREEMIPITKEFLFKIKSIIFILTDGKANMGGDPQEQAKLLKSAGVEIYCIGITSSYLQDSLYKIASENEAGSKDEHVFILENYPTMSWLVQVITNGTIDYSQCGLGLEKVGKVGRGRIAGGGEAADPWPWMAAIYHMSPDKRLKLFCGGSVINEKFILTAAHCMYQPVNKKLRRETNIIVKLGLTNVHNESTMDVFEVKKYYIPQEYRFGQYFDYDIALLKLKRPIEFNAFIRPVCLPPSELPANSTLYKIGQHSVATGWGHDRVLHKLNTFEVRTTKHLKELIFPIQSREACSQSLKENHHEDQKFFTERMFCVGDGNGGNDTCKGDSGGPLVQSQLNADGNVYWTQIGIISWGIGCGLPNTYGYYTHVQKLYSWIENTITANL